MRTERIEGPNEPDRDKRGHNDRPRPRRGAANGPLGFGTVMRDVKGGAGDPGALTPGSANFDAAAYAAAQASVGGQASRAMGSVESTEARVEHAAAGVESAGDALTRQDSTATGALARADAALPSQLGKMSPSTLLTTVLDEATKHEITEAMKELHVELEPEDLGPVVVEIKRGPSGKLDIRFRAREADAARVLDSGSDLLRERLAEAGFAGADVRVDHDVELVFDRRH